MKEKELQNKVIKLFKEQNILYVKHNNGLHFMKGTKGYYPINNGTKGMPDLEIYTDGEKPLFIEFKTDINKLSEAQIKMFLRLKILHIYPRVLTPIRFALDPNNPYEIADMWDKQDPISKDYKYITKKLAIKYREELE